MFHSLESYRYPIVKSESVVLHVSGSESVVLHVSGSESVALHVSFVMLLPVVVHCDIKQKRNYFYTRCPNACL